MDVVVGDQTLVLARVIGAQPRDLLWVLIFAPVDEHVQRAEAAATPALWHAVPFEKDQLVLPPVHPLSPLSELVHGLGELIQWREWMNRPGNPLIFLQTYG